MGTINSITEVCLTAVHSADLSTCKPLGFDLIGWATIIPLIGGTAVFLVRRWTKPRADPQGKLRHRFWQKPFKVLCGAILPFLKDNHRIFRTFGPNSGAGDGRPKIVRHNLGVWYQMRSRVVENNDKIRHLIQSNFAEIPAQHQALFQLWINHIDAFAAHVVDPSVDYRNHQFPAEVELVVRSNA